MKDMERQKFEGEWQEAFGKAEISPSENLWTNIELDLIKAEGEKMKRRLFFYKLTAAASIAFAMCVAGVGTYFYKNPPASYIAANTINNGNAGVDNSLKESNAVGMQSNKTASAEVSNSSDDASSNVEGVDNANKNTTATSSNNSNSEMRKGGSVANAERAESTENNLSNISLNNQLADINADVKKSNDFNREYEVTANYNDSDVSNGSANSSKISHEDQTVVITQNQTLTSNDVPVKNESNLSVTKPVVNTLLASERIKYAPQQKEVDPFLVMMAKLEQRERELRDDKKTEKGKKKSKNSNEKLWTSFAFAAGSFSSANSNVNSLETSLNQQPSNSLSAARNNTAEASKDVAAKQSKASGTAYSLGMSIGTKVSERWVVHGGVNYLSQMSSYETTTIGRDGDSNFNLFTIKEAAKSSEPNVTSTAPYNVNSNLQFISVPIQAGYMALKRKFGIQINTGLSTELFLQSVASAVVNNQSKSVRDGWGSESPYRTVNFSGLFGTEFSYRFGDRYRVALNPGLRYPFSSLYKSEIGVKSIPLTVDVGVKLRYIFR